MSYVGEIKIKNHHFKVLILLIYVFQTLWDMMMMKRIKTREFVNIFEEKCSYQNGSFS
jgi:hypothetical protein